MIIFSGFVVVRSQNRLGPALQPYKAPLIIPPPRRSAYHFHHLDQHTLRPRTLTLTCRSLCQTWPFSTVLHGNQSWRSRPRATKRYHGKRFFCRERRSSEQKHCACSTWTGYLVKFWVRYGWKQRFKWILQNTHYLLLNQHVQTVQFTL